MGWLRVMEGEYDFAGGSSGSEFLLGVARVLECECAMDTGRDLAVREEPDEVG